LWEVEDSVTARKASWRRAFDPCAPLLFILYNNLEQNLHFGLVTEPPQVLSARSFLVARFSTLNIPRSFSCGNRDFALWEVEGSVITETSRLPSYSQSHLGSHFRMLFQRSKLKARTSLFTETWQKRRSSFELSKMSPQVGSAVKFDLRVEFCKVSVITETARLPLQDAEGDVYI